MTFPILSQAAIEITYHDHSFTAWVPGRHIPLWEWRLSFVATDWLFSGITLSIDVFPSLRP